MKKNDDSWELHSLSFVNKNRIEIIKYFTYTMPLQSSPTTTYVLSLLGNLLHPIQNWTMLSISRISRLSTAPRAISQYRSVAFSTTSGEAPASATDDTSSASTSAPPSPESTRRRALSLYRQLLRGAERMPTPNRQNYIKRKTRSEYRRHKTLTDPEEIDFLLRLADTNLDTVLVQAEHLSRLFNDPEYQNYN